jgi:lipopolysaccharide export system permease protein
MNRSTLFLYVARLFALRVVAFLCLLVGILQTLDLLEESNAILAVPGAGYGQVLQYISLRLPQLINQFGPFALLLAVLTTLVTLAQSSEVVIMKAAGLSPHTILRPLFLVAGLFAFAHFLFAELVVVHALDRLRTWQAADYALNMPPAKRGSGKMWVTDGNSIIYAKSVGWRDRALVLDHVEIFDRTETGNMTRIINAQRAILQDGQWRLQDVRRIQLPSGVTSKVTEETWETRIPADRFVAVAVEPERVSYWRLRGAIKELRAGGHSTDALEASLHHKVSGPLSSLLMPLMGAVAAFGLARSGGLFVRVVIGMALGFAYFVADNMMLALGQFGATPPLLAAWSPFLLFFLIGEAVLFRTEE